MTIDFATLFARLGKGIGVIAAANTARGSTIPPKVQAYYDEFDGADLDLQRSISPAEAANRSFQSAAAGLVNGMKSSMQSVLLATVADDANLEREDISNALAELVRQLEAEGESVDASTVAVTPSAIVGNGDGVLVASAKRSDGLVQENALAEAIRLECTSDTSPATAVFTARGAVSVADRLAHTWPAGSGINRSITATNAASTNLLTNGGFDDENDRPNTPDDWVLSVGTIGTTVKMTDYEVQQIVVTGSPSAGTYSVSWQSPAGHTLTTLPLAYNAAGPTLQAALRTLPGLETVEVTPTGTSPNYTHAITFTGIAGNLNQVTVTNNTTGGTFTPSTTTGGSANAFVGKAVEFDSDGTQLTTLNQALALEPLTQYAFNIWALADVVPAAGVLTIDLVDGIGGTVIQDEAGANNSFTIACSALTTSFAARSGVFRTPRVMPAVVYLRIRISTGVSAGTSIFLDHAALVAMSELYKGGPAVAIFSGKVAFVKGSGQVEADEFTLAVANNRAGAFQEWFDRLFDMRAKGLLLPSNAAGAETILDSLIS